MEVKIETLGLGYSFDPVNKKVILIGARKFVKLRVLSIINTTRNIVLWSNPEMGNIRRNGNNIEVYFPNVSTTGHASTDSLMIFIDVSFEELNISSLKALIATEVYPVTPSDKC